MRSPSRRILCGEKLRGTTVSADGVGRNAGVHQTHLDGTPEPTRVRQGKRGPHPKPAGLLPKRTVRFKAYERQANDLAAMIAAGVGKSEADLLRTLIEDKARELRAAGVLKPAPKQETLAL